MGTPWLISGNPASSCAVIIELAFPVVCRGYHARAISQEAQWAMSSLRLGLVSASTVCTYSQPLFLPFACKLSGTVVATAPTEKTPASGSLEMPSPPCLLTESSDWRVLTCPPCFALSAAALPFVLGSLHRWQRMIYLKDAHPSPRPRHRCQLRASMSPTSCWLEKK